MPKLDVLLTNLKSKDKTIVKKALEELGALGDIQAVPALLELIDNIKDEDILESLLWNLARIAPTKTLMELLNHPSQLVVIEMIDALGRLAALESVDAITPFTEHPNAELRAIATWALGKMHVARTYQILTDLLRTDEDPLVRANAAWAIGKFEEFDSIALLKAVKDTEIDESVLYNLEEAIEHVQETQDPQHQGQKLTVYECASRENDCVNKKTFIEEKSDTNVTIVIKYCENCERAKICQVDLIRKQPDEIS
jgi:HEAT repeat protein